MSYYIYILESQKDKGFYIGVTSDIKRRLEEHNSGLSKSTKPRQPFKLVRVEEFPDSKSAYNRERFLKSKKSSKIIRKIIES